MKQEDTELLAAINQNLIALIQDQQRLIVLLESLTEHKDTVK